MRIRLTPPLYSWILFFAFLRENKRVIFDLKINNLEALIEQSSETTAKGTGLAKSAGKEDPIEIDSSLTPTIDR
ncbi:hypothetical protein G9A89_005325 [Geosiphon pyriformis]|nr:hypothetical protein G9A89_005325 [Geosiphon pyriformis]